MTGRWHASFCSHCGGVYTTRKDGMIRKHDHFVSFGTYHAGPVWRPCPGSGKPPKEVDDVGAR